MNRDSNEHDEPPRPARKRYEAPRILSREPLEVMAGLCVPKGIAKVNPGLCPQGPINS
jgi:hypothetical protein